MGLLGRGVWLCFPTSSEIMGNFGDSVLRTIFTVSLKVFSAAYTYFALSSDSADLVWFLFSERRHCWTLDYFLKFVQWFQELWLLC